MSSRHRFAGSGLRTEYIARRTVAAVSKDRRHVRTPRRLSTQFWLNETPRRINELVLTGVKMGPNPSKKD